MKKLIIIISLALLSISGISQEFEYRYVTTTREPFNTIYDAGKVILVGTSDQFYKLTATTPRTNYTMQDVIRAGTYTILTLPYSSVDTGTIKTTTNQTKYGDLSLIGDMDASTLSITTTITTGGNITGNGTANHLLGVGAASNIGLLTLGSEGGGKFVLDDIDASDDQAPMWYLQSANNGSAGRFYIGWADRSSGTVMTGGSDVMVVTETAFTLGSTDQVGTQDLYMKDLEVNQVTHLDNTSTWSDAISREEVLYLAEGGTITLTASTSGIIEIYGESYGITDTIYASAHFSSDAAVALHSTSSGNVTTTITTSNLCIVDSGSQVSIINRIGRTIMMYLRIKYFTPSFP